MTKPYADLIFWLRYRKWYYSLEEQLAKETIAALEELQNENHLPK